MKDLIQQLRENSKDVDTLAAKFLAVVSAKRMNKAKEALGILLPAYVAGEIYGPEYREAKDYLSWVVSESWRSKTDHFWVGKGGDNAEGDFMNYISGPSNMHEVLSFKKKLGKLKPTTKLSKYSDYKLSDVNPEYVRVAHEFADAAYPIALILKEMKSKVIKGKKPNPEAIAKKAAALALKDMKTCACCFRSIAALKNGKIADHGYTLHQGWGKSASCPGGMFKPLEVSSAGLKYMVEGISGRLAQLKSELAKSGELKALTVKKGWGGELETLTPDSPKWNNTHKSHVHAIEKDIEFNESSLANYKTRLSHWKPAP